MGCNFQDKILDGKLTKDEVKSKFGDLQDQDRYENGHCYSGGFGMATGIKFKDRIFETEDDAYSWLSENAEKWGDALCVRFKSANGESWMIGANCAS